MKNSLLIAFVGLVWCARVLADNNPYVFAVLVDEEPASKKRAAAFLQYLKSTDPFSKMGDQIKFKVLPLTAAEMECSNKNSASPRIISCNTAKMAALGSTVNANRTIAFTSKGSGGAGGSVPVASPDYPLTTMLHELMHSYGFADEYKYSASEAALYCKSPPKAPNLVGFAAKKNPFTGDTEARGLHGGDVPWFLNIQLATLVTTNNILGTAPMPVYPKGTVGLFRAGVCDSKIPTWRPYDENTIMKDLTIKDLPPLYRKSIVDAMAAERHQKFTLVDPPAPELTKDQADAPLKSVVAPEPKPAGASDGSTSKTKAN